MRRSGAKPTFERLRRTRHAAQYFDPSTEISADDAAWALSTARAVVLAVEHLRVSDPPELFG